MNHLTYPFRKIDAAVQAAVDAVVIWLYRRGVPRPLIFYVLGIITVGSLFMQVALEGRFITAVIIVVLGAFGTEWFLRRDQEQEKKPDTADWRLRGMQGEWYWKVFNIGMGIFDCWIETTAAGFYLSAIFWTACVIDIYVAASPRRPPPIKQARSIHVPVPDAA